MKERRGGERELKGEENGEEVGGEKHGEIIGRRQEREGKGALAKGKISRKASPPSQHSG